ncbi:hypothetical protein A3Q56_00686 [Intoshia linei]|uniref:Uncharacterized protein n=1 Tax=Intoshia linei TaxID=1819745 RepID=A0A177BB62_9BILA|nr:hypothetical protein A3Q56_00686 [Intoshia linei]
MDQLVLKQIDAKNVSDVKEFYNDLQVLKNNQLNLNERKNLIDKLLKFLKFYLPFQEISKLAELVIFVSQKILNEVEPKFFSNHVNHQIRHGILNIIKKIPLGESFRKFSNDVIKLMFEVIWKDNEVNAIEASKIIMECSKQYRCSYSSDFKNIFTRIKDLYRHITNNLDNFLLSPDAYVVEIKGKEESCEEKILLANIDKFCTAIVKLNPNESYYSDEHFPVITEGATTVRLVNSGKKNFNCVHFRKYGHRNKMFFLPTSSTSLLFLIEITSNLIMYYQLFKQTSISIEIANMGLSLIQVVPNSSAFRSSRYNHTTMIYFIECQVRMIAYLSYYIRHFTLENMKECVECLILSIQKIVQICPIEIGTMRRDLLLAMKNSIGICMKSPKKYPTIVNIHNFIREDCLLGSEYEIRQHIRHIVYVCVHDLIYISRRESSLQDIKACIFEFSSNFRYFGVSQQTIVMSLHIVTFLVTPLGTTFCNDSESVLRICYLLLKYAIKNLKYFLKYKLKIIKKIVEQGDMLRVTQTTELVNNYSPPENKQLRLTECRQYFISVVKVASAAFQSIMQVDGKRTNRNISPRKIFDNQDRCVNINQSSQMDTSVKSFISVRSDVRTCNKSSDSMDEMKGNYSAMVCLSIMESKILKQILFYGIKSFDIFNYEQLKDGEIVRKIDIVNPIYGKEEKATMDSFAQIYNNLHGYALIEVMKPSIQFLIDQMFINPVSQMLINIILSVKIASPCFSIVLIEYLIKNLEKLGTNSLHSTLYLKLFKHIFAAITVISIENEKSVKVHLKTIIQKCLDLSLNAETPENYFLLLRALFRSIGGGSHEDIYKEFLPLLPYLLKNFNKLQNCEYKPETKDLIVELCLTVPVRLSSLLPHLPLLMDPLITALKSKSSLQTQGLRTLELCVDNLQPDFLYDHFKPVQTELIQCLWKIISTTDDSMAHMAFRLLGKFGGHTRAVLREPQSVDYEEVSDEYICNASIYFSGNSTPVKLPIFYIIDNEFKNFISFNFKDTASNFNISQSWVIVKGILSSILHTHDLRLLKKYINRRFMRHGEIPKIQHYLKKPIYTHKGLNSVVKRAISCMIMIYHFDEFREEVLKYICNMTRICTSFSIIEQYYYSEQDFNCNFIYSCVLVDAIIDVLHDPTNDYTKICQIIISLIFECVSKSVGELDRCCKICIVDYAFEKLIYLCYETSWYVKQSGCAMLNFMLHRYNNMYLLYNSKKIFTALMYLLNDLAGKISSDTFDLANSIFAKLLNIIYSVTDESCKNFKIKVLEVISLECIKNLSSPHSLVRSNVKYFISEICNLSGISIENFLLKYKILIKSLVPPNYSVFMESSPWQKLGIMDAFTYVMKLSPECIDFHTNNATHKSFFDCIIGVVDSSDEIVSKLACFKNSFETFQSLKLFSIKCLGTLNLNFTEAEKIQLNFSNIIVDCSSNDDYEWLTRNTLALCAIEELYRFTKGDSTVLLCLPDIFNPLYAHLADIPKNGMDSRLGLVVAERILKLYEKFPRSMTQQLAFRTIDCFKNWISLLQTLIDPNYDITGYTESHESKIANMILKFFVAVQYQSKMFFNDIANVVFNIEKKMIDYGTSPFRSSLYAIWENCPDELGKIMLTHFYIANHHVRDVFFDFLKRPNAIIPPRLMDMDILLNLFMHDSFINSNRKNIIPYLDHCLFRVLHVEWNKIVRRVYGSSVESIPYELENFEREWEMEIGRLALKILIKYIKHQYQDIPVFFDLFKVYSETTLLETFSFDGNVKKIIQKSSISWKRDVCGLFMQMYRDACFNTAHAYYIMKMLILPIFNASCGAPEGLFINPVNIKAYFDMQRNDKDTLQFVVDTDITYVDATIYEYLSDVQKCMTPLNSYFKLIPPKSVNSNSLNKMINLDSANIQYLKYSQCDLNLIKLYFETFVLNPPNLKIHAKNVFDGNGSQESISIKMVALEIISLLAKHFSGILLECNLEISKDELLNKLIEYTRIITYNISSTDAIMKFQGFLTLSHIINSFSVDEYTTKTFFFEILRSANLEVKSKLHEITDILIPAIIKNLENGKELLFTWTMVLVAEEAFSSINLLYALVQIIVKHKYYYLGFRHLFLSQLVQSVNVLGSRMGNKDYVKAGIDFADVIVRWLESDDASKMLTDNEKSTYSYLLQSCLKYSFHFFDVTTVNDHNSITVRFLKIAKRLIVLLKNVEFNFNWLTKFVTVDNCKNPPTYTHIMAALAIYRILISELPIENAIQFLNTIEDGIMSVISHANLDLIKVVAQILNPIIKHHPFAPEAIPYYTNIDKIQNIYKFLSSYLIGIVDNYDKIDPNVYKTIALLEMIGSGNNSFIKSIISSYVRWFHRIIKQYFMPLRNEESKTTNGIKTNVIMMGIELTRDTINSMNSETRKIYIIQTLSVIIEKIQDHNVLKKIISFVHDWVVSKFKYTDSHPSQKEISNLLVKLFNNLCFKRYSDNPDLSKPYLETVIYIYKNQSFSGDLVVKLEPIFITGLRCPEPGLRLQYNKIFHECISKTVVARLYYIIVNQNWDAMLIHFWIKQCIELIFSIVEPKHVMTAINCKFYVPTANRMFLIGENDNPDMIISNSDTFDYDHYTIMHDNKNHVDKTEPTEQVYRSERCIPFIEINDKCKSSTIFSSINSFIKDCSKYFAPVEKITTRQFIMSISQICYKDTTIAYDTWVHIFPQLWKMISSSDRSVLTKELERFLTSSNDGTQREPAIHPSCINCFIEGLYRCDPPVVIRPSSMKHLSVYHKIWHRSAMYFETELFKLNSTKLTKFKPTNVDKMDLYPSREQEIFDCLQSIYGMLEEHDMLLGLWFDRSYFRSTLNGLKNFCSFNFFKSQKNFEYAMSQAARYDANIDSDETLVPEYKFIERSWIQSCKELNHWDTLLAYSTAPENSNIFLAADCVWRMANWNTLKDLLPKIEINLPREYGWKVNVYRGYLSLVTLDDIHHLATIETYISNAFTAAIKLWRRFPNICTNSNIPLLYATQQIVELSESFNMIKSQINSLSTNRSTAYHEFGSQIKTWRNRLPMICDSLAHWSNIMLWRRHHFQAMDKFFTTNPPDACNEHITPAANHSVVNSLLTFATVARKHGCLDICDQIICIVSKMPSLSMADSFIKLKETVKCYFSESRCLATGLNYLDSAEPKCFNKEINARVFSLKGRFLKKLKRYQQANQCLSAAIQMNDTSPGTWRRWGELQEILFYSTKNLNYLVSAVTCYLHVCQKKDNEKSRVSIAKIMWLLNYEVYDKIAGVFMNYGGYIYPSNWINWIHRIVSFIGTNANQAADILLNLISKQYYQAVFIAIRSLILSLFNSNYKIILNVGQLSEISNKYYRRCTIFENYKSFKSILSLRSSSPLLDKKLLTLRNLLIAIHRNNIINTRALCQFIDEISSISISWHEDIYCSLNKAVKQFYKECWFNKNNMQSFKISIELKEFIMNIIERFRQHIKKHENRLNVDMLEFNNTAFFGLPEDESNRQNSFKIYRRLFAMFQNNFEQCLQLSNPWKLIDLLNKWVCIFQMKLKVKSRKDFSLIPNKYRFLRNYSAYYAEIVLPGEYLVCRSSPVHIMLNGFSPFINRVNINDEIHNVLTLIASNGCKYPFIISNTLTSSLNDLELYSKLRIYKLMNFCNYAFENNINASTRFHNFLIPRFQIISPYLCMIEYNMSTFPLSSIYYNAPEKSVKKSATVLKQFYDVISRFPSDDDDSFDYQASSQFLSDYTRSSSDKLLTDWADQVYNNSTSYWHFRKMFTIHYGMMCCIQYSLGLNPINLNNILIVREYAFLQPHGLHINLNETNKTIAPFRLTKNITKFITKYGINGPFATSIINSARCFLNPKLYYDTFIRTIFRDEIAYKHSLRSIVFPKEIIHQCVLHSEAVMCRVKDLSLIINLNKSVIDTRELIKISQTDECIYSLDPRWLPWV